MSAEEILKSINYNYDSLKYINLSEKEILYLISYDDDIIYYIPIEKLSKNIIKYIIIKRRIITYDMKKVLTEELILEILNESPYSFITLEEVIPIEKQNFFFKKIENKIESIGQNSPDIFKKSPIIALKNIEIDVNRLNYFYSEALTPSVIKRAIELGYKYDKHLTSDSVLSNEEMVLYLMKSDVQVFERAKKGAITKRTIKYAFDNGFKYNKNSLLLKSKTFILELIKLYPNILNYVDESIIDDEIVKSAQKHGYCFKFIGERNPLKVNFFGETFSDDHELIYNNNLFLLDYDELVLSSYKNGYGDIIFAEDISINNKYYEWILTNSINNKVKINHIRNTKLLKDDRVIDYIYSSLYSSPISKKYLEKYINLFGINNCFKNIKNLSLILSPSFISTFDDNKIKLIIKHIIINDSELPLEIVLNNISLNNLKTILERMTNSTLKTFYPVAFSKLIYYLNDNINLTKELNNVDNSIIDNLIFLINTNEKCDSIEYLINLHENRKEKVLNNKDLSLKEKLYKILYGARKSEVEYYLDTILNSKKLKMINIDPQYNDYVNSVKLLDKIFNSDDEVELISILNNLENYKFFSIDELISFARNAFYDLYNLTKISDLKVSEYIDNVPIIHMTGEDYSVITHSLNGFNKEYALEYSIDDFFKDSLGKPYLCTSNNSDIHNSSPSNNNDIYLIFDDFSKEQLYMISNKSVHLKSSDNNPLNMREEPGNFLPPFIMTCLTEEYNEFDYYRENNEGKLMKPKALMTYNTISENQLKFAKQYNLKIVVIHEEKYLERNAKMFDQLKKELYNDNLSNAEYLIGLSRSLRIELTDEELGLLLEYYSDNLEYIKTLLELFNYDVNHLINKSKKKSS